MWFTESNGIKMYLRNGRQALERAEVLSALSFAQHYGVGEPSRFARFEVRKAGRFAYFALKTGSGLFLHLGEV
jgi:hypothetical protein